MVWARSSWHMMMAPRGPRSVLWVVVVMTCASPAGYLVTGQELRLSVDAVVDEAIQLAREVDIEPVGQMATLGQVHAHGHVPRLHEGGVDGPVGLGAAVGLHVDVVGAEQLPRAADSQLLHLVYVLAAAVVAPAGT